MNNKSGGGLVIGPQRHEMFSHRFQMLCNAFGMRLRANCFYWVQSRIWRLEFH